MDFLLVAVTALNLPDLSVSQHAKRTIVHGTGLLSILLISVVAGLAPVLVLILEMAHSQANDLVRYYRGIMIRDPINEPYTFAGNSTVHG
ncbi:hypothetical protein RHGRI_020660 [Rhododendron griersonianum]|uniref:Uncharacterized protein n=1 Tax=Rhododendron griersonianum TaxID=479676 RepID=A0AAV6JLI5_9ERIC|nr:hypothetical protein RHGRI_020660 [Rhododendron griersonianum]